MKRSQNHFDRKGFMKHLNSHEARAPEIILSLLDGTHRKSKYLGEEERQLLGMAKASMIEDAEIGENQLARLNVIRKHVLARIAARRAAWEIYSARNNMTRKKRKQNKA